MFSWSLVVCYGLYRIPLFYSHPHSYNLNFKHCFNHNSPCLSKYKIPLLISSTKCTRTRPRIFFVSFFRITLVKPPILQDPSNYLTRNNRVYSLNLLTIQGDSIEISCIQGYLPIAIICRFLWIFITITYFDILLLFFILCLLFCATRN